MQSNTKTLSDLDKRKTCIGQYDVPPPSDCSTMVQLQEQIRIKIHSEQILKAGKSDKPKTTESITKLKDRAKSSEGSGMESEQLDAILNLSARVINKNCKTE